MKPRILFASVMLAATGAQGWAQEVSSSPSNQPGPAQTAKEKPRPVSPTVAALLDAAMPKYSPPGADSKNQPAGVKPQNSIVHLSEYIVREARPPRDEDIMTKSAREDWAMNTYLGSPHDFNRGVINHYTLGDLWAKIPVVGKLPFFASTTNSSRAMDHYYDEGLPREIRDLQQLDSFGDGTVAAPKPADSAPKP